MSRIYLRALLGPVLLICFSAQAKIKIEYRNSQLQGLYIFSNAISNPKLNSEFKELFLKSPYNNPKFSSLLNDLFSLRAQPFGSCNEASASTTTKVNSSYELFTQQLLIQSAFSKNLDELSLRVVGLAPLSMQSRYFEILSEIQPVYMRLILSGATKSQESFKGGLERAAENRNMDKYLSEAAHFLRSAWPDEIPNSVNLYPLPSSAPNFDLIVYPSGTALGVPQNSKDFAQALEKSFVGLVENFFFAQKNDFRQEQLDYFKGLEAFRSTRIVKRNYKKIIAGSLALNWLSHFQGSGPNAGVDWKNNFYGEQGRGVIEEIQDTLKDYLANGKNLDREFVRVLVNIYETKYPTAAYFYENIFANSLCYLNKDLPNNISIWNELEKYFPTSTFNMIDDPNIARLAPSLSSDESALYLLQKKDNAKFRELAKSFEPLKKELRNFSNGKGPKLWAGYDSKNRPYVVIRAENMNEFEAAFQKMSEAKNFDPTSVAQKL